MFNLHKDDTPYMRYALKYQSENLHHEYPVLKYGYSTITFSQLLQRLHSAAVVPRHEIGPFPTFFCDLSEIISTLNRLDSP